MRILNRDRDIFATMMLKGVLEQEAYGNIYKVYVVGTNCANVDDGLIVTTYNIIKQDGRGCTESTYAVLETPFDEGSQPIAFIAGRWAYAYIRDTNNTTRIWEQEEIQNV